jgi:hypothetical protein
LSTENNPGVDLFGGAVPGCDQAVAKKEPRKGWSITTGKKNRKNEDMIHLDAKYTAI